MDHRRFITFLVCFFSFSFLYTNFVAPRFFPQPEIPVETAGQDEQDGDASAEDAAASDQEISPPGEEGAPAEVVVELEQNPSLQLTIGSQDYASGYFLEVRLTTKGAAIESVVLADPKFKDLEDQQRQVQVVGNNATEDRSFSTAVSAIDAQLSEYDQTLETTDWRVVSSDTAEAVFDYTSPDGQLKVTKAYRLKQVEVTEANSQQELRSNAGAYTIEVELTVANLGQSATEVTYEIQGPVGVVMENKDHTRKYRDIKLEFLGDDDAVTMPAKKVIGLYGDATGPDDLKRQQVQQEEAWTAAFRYVGVDVQFFAALTTPLDERPVEEQTASPWIERAYPVLISEDDAMPNASDISFRMQSTTLALKGHSSVTHKFGFFVGPKRSSLLDPPPLEAEQVLDYGSWFGFIARFMHTLLDTLHGFGLPYVFAIIGLTVIVRGCMFPLSRKQAISAARMKELQPKINELKARYGDDKEKFAKAQMELWRKHKINPFGGCLPLLFQFPVFVALYSCLNTAVDLRLSRFLWIDNLAAPDALFQMPFSLPFLGSDFNLLPCVTVVLFLIQQKLFMPPPADEQAEIQQKMMNFMTIFMGVMFWHVPAGLCIYFTASSLWGIAERKLLGTGALTPDTALEDADSDVAEQPSVKVKSKGKATAEPKKKGFFERLADKAEELQKQMEEQQKQQAGKGRGAKGKGKGKGKR
ncbi:MAG: membrane protein insertase YidC [Planctomycetaceae bacterium]|nr:membrane protein insertase YidC [Planctomycetaceae bacterium]